MMGMSQSNTKHILPNHLHAQACQVQTLCCPGYKSAPCPSVRTCLAQGRQETHRPKGQGHPWSCQGGKSKEEKSGNAETVETLGHQGYQDVEQRRSLCVQCDCKETRLDHSEHVREDEGKEKTPQPGGGGIFPFHFLCELGAGIRAGGIITG